MTVIKCDVEQLPVGLREQLLAWLGMPEVKVLVYVVDSKVKKYQVAAMNEALQASEGNLKLESANASLKQAQRYVHFLEVLEELVSRREPFEISKLT